MNDRRRWAFFATPWGSGRVFVSEGVLAGVVLPRLGQSCGSGAERLPANAADKPSLLHESDASPTLPPESNASPPQSWESHVLLSWVERLEAYFRGERLAFGLDEVPLDKLADTAFRLDVYRALLQVPPGDTVSYSELALLAGHPRAARAVGTAMATNPVPVVVPCHRVVLADGRLGRYGEDPAWKELLVQHERTYVSRRCSLRDARRSDGGLRKGLASDGQG